MGQPRAAGKSARGRGLAPGSAAGLSAGTYGLSLAEAPPGKPPGPVASAGVVRAAAIRVPPLALAPACGLAGHTAAAAGNDAGQAGRGIARRPRIFPHCTAEATGHRGQADPTATAAGPGGKPLKTLVYALRQGESLRRDSPCVGGTPFGLGACTARPNMLDASPSTVAILSVGVCAKSANGQPSR